MKGIIALDIDGTITTEAHSMPEEVASFLENIQKEGWRLLFITGRNFKWAYSVLSRLSASYFLALQNGAILLKMPDKEILTTKYLNSSILPLLSQICQKEGTDFVIYSGFEHQDICYYRSKNFPQEILNYLEARKKALNEAWVDVLSFDDLEIKEFASVKCIGKEDAMSRIASQIEEKLKLHAPLNRDPFDGGFYVVQATHPQATKGNALKSFIECLAWDGPVIAAGDDYNDLSMLEAAKIKVVMGDAPASLISLADIIAPPASLKGIIQGLHNAIELSYKRML